jgi:4-alpha-glucanotransferase
MDRLKKVRGDGVISDSVTDHGLRRKFRPCERRPSRGTRPELLAPTSPPGRTGTPRVAGVTLPLFSIRTRKDWGIGQITDLPACAAWIRTAGHKLLQILPAYELAAGETSPYGARTAFGLDPIYIDIDAVPDLDERALRGALGEAGLREIERLRSTPRVEYGPVRFLKERALHAAYERFIEREWKPNTERAKALRSFIDDSRAWEADLALYVALRERQGGWSWQQWPEPEKRRDPQAMAAARSELAGRILEHQYGQWIAHEQWVAARREMNRLGVELMGDLPFIVGHESADVWAHASEFRRDVSLGAPPDPFSEDGQDWGLPAYDWAAMDANDLDWLRRRTERASTLFDRFRLDHVVGYFRMYVKRMGEKHGEFDPKEQEQQVARGARVLSALQASAGGAKLVAEDLGVVPPFVRETLVSRGVPGYRVLPWENDAGKFRDPKEFPRSSVATWGTHDTPPIVAWWDELPLADRGELARLAGIASDTSRELRWLPLLRLLLHASSELTLLLVTEVLGSSDRINTPGTVGAANWIYRLPKPLEDLERDPDVLWRMSALAQVVRESGR